MKSDHLAIIARKIVPFSELVAKSAIDRTWLDQVYNKQFEACFPFYTGSTFARGDYGKEVSMRFLANRCVDGRNANISQGRWS